MVVKHPNLYLQELISHWNSLILTSCFCFLLVVTGFSQTVILGTAPGYEEATITASNYHNYITSDKKELATSTVDLGGSFVITLPKDHNELVLIDLGFLEFQLFATEGYRYVVEIDRFSPNSSNVSLRVVEAPENDLNQLIPEFEEKYVTLADSLYPYILRSGKRLIVDSVFDELAAEAKQSASAYMRTYVDFNIALIKQMTHKSKMTQFAQDYIINQPVSEGNIAYMNFINQYFANYFSVLAMKPEKSKIPDLVNKKKDVIGVLNELKRDPNLANDTLRELILLKSLYEAYYDPEFREQMVLDMIDSLASKTQIKIHVELAENIKATLSLLRKGFVAPEISLKDEGGNLISLSDLQGKYIYINFWATWSVPSLMEMKVMPALVEKYGEQVIFVHISVDKEAATMVKFLKDQELVKLEHKSKEYYLHYGVQKRIMSDYRIESIPHYVFLDKEGKIVQVPAERPSGKIETMFSGALVDKKEQPTITDPGDE